MLPCLRRWGPALAMMALLFALSAWPDDQGQNPHFGDWDPLVRKSAHLLGYALLAAAYLSGLAGPEAHPSWRVYALAWVLAVAYAATDELHQSFVPGRNAAVSDILLDGVGAAAGLVARAIWRETFTGQAGKSPAPR